jgi:hypothetical protein
VNGKSVAEDTVMNTTLKRLCTFLLLGSAVAVTSAASAQNWGYRFQNERQQQDRRADERRQSYDRFNSDRHYERDEQPRRDSRMSPDERRALRQQIDEAGRDIYRRR